MQVLFTILISFLAVTLFGHVAHWAFHQSWSGRFYRAHLTHHRLYTPTDFQSAVYRDPGKDSTAFIFFFLGLPIIAIPIVFSLLGELSWLCCLISIGVIGLFGILNDIIHDSFHIKNHGISRWWPRYSNLRKMHLLHHINVQTNFGIFTFIWDFVFMTRRTPPVNFSE